MKTIVPFLSYLAQFLSEWETFLKKVVEQIKTHTLRSKTFLSENLAFNLGKYGTAGQATDGSIIRRMRIACWMTKATDTHTQNM